VLELIDLINMPQRQPDVVQAFHQPPPGVVVNLEFGVKSIGGDLPADEVDGDGCGGVLLDEVPELLDDLLIDDSDQQPGLA
jgi:hypothetical protein